jgi:hypothetical protein
MALEAGTLWRLIVTYKLRKLSAGGSAEAASSTHQHTGKNKSMK